MNIKNKVFAYIVKENSLLVFKHTDHPDAGIQVPAGTVENEEPLENAVVREAREETGLESLVIVKYLGKSEYRAVGKNELHNRYFFQLHSSDKMIHASWQHGERNPIHFSEIDKKYGMIRFYFYWLNLDEAKDVLSYGHNALMSRIERKQQK